MMEAEQKGTWSCVGSDEEKLRQHFLKLAGILLSYISKIFMRHNVLVPELERIVRWEGVKIALNDPEFSIDDREDEDNQTHSHAAVLTGLTRQEVAHSKQLEKAPVEVSGGDIHRIIRVLTAWRTEPGYQNKAGHPIDLPLRGPAPSLHQLCLKYGRNATTRSVVDVIVKNGNAQWIGSNGSRVHGKELRYLNPVVTADNDINKNLAIFTQIGSDFLHSYQKMLDPKLAIRPRFREGYYNDIAKDKADEALAELHEKMQEFNVLCTEILKKYRAEKGEPTVRLGVGLYSFRDAPLLLGKFPHGMSETRAI